MGSRAGEATAASISGPGVPRCPWEVRPVVRPCPVERGFPERRYSLAGVAAPMHPPSSTGVDLETDAPPPPRCEDLYVRLHYNEVVCLGLAPTHFALQSSSSSSASASSSSRLEGVQAAAAAPGQGGRADVGEGQPLRRVTRVAYRGGFKAPQSKSDRKAGTFLEPNSLVCDVTLDDGTSFAVRAGVKALLLETNGALEKDPDLLTRAPSTEGWLALLQPRGKNVGKANRDVTVSEDAYRVRLLGE